MIVEHMTELFTSLSKRTFWGRCQLITYIVVRLLLIIVNHVYCIPTYVVWMILLLPFRWLYPRFYWYGEAKFFRWLLAMICMWMWTAGYAIYESNLDELAASLTHPALVLINHQSTGDVPTLFYILQHHKEHVESVMWLMDKEFKYTLFGMVSIIHGDFFILQGKEHRITQLDYLRQHLIEKYWPRPRKWIMLFPEGGFLRKRRNNSQKFAEKKSLPHLQHLTLPRVGAMGEILETVGPTADTKNSSLAVLKYVVDITIAYGDGGRPLDLQSVVCGWRDRTAVRIYYRVYPIMRGSEENVSTKDNTHHLTPDIYQNQEKLTDWLYARYEEKEKLLEYYYTHGHFGVAEERVDIGLVYCISLHIFFFISSLHHYYLLSFIYNTFF